jgi:hypothetical protein
MRRAAIDQYKMDLGCEVCGYADNPVALDLDHKNPAEKVKKVSRLICCASWVDVLKELDKCRVLCAICHRIKTQEDRQLTDAL